MYKIKAIQGVNISISDLGLVVTSNTEQIISDEQYNSSADLEKVRNFLIITEVKEDNDCIVEETIESTKTKNEKTIFTKEIEDLEDEPKVVKEKKEKIFTAMHNEPEFDLNIEEKVVEKATDFKPVVEEVATPIVRDAENGKIVNASGSFITDINSNETKAEEKVKKTSTRKTSTKKVNVESSEKKTKSSKKAKTVTTEEKAPVATEQVKIEKSEK